MDTPQALVVAASGQKGPSLRRERGQTLVVVAVMIVLLVAFLGLVIDGGNVYAQRRQMQNAADAAALAGARAQVIEGTSAAVSKADQYAKTNGAQACVVVTTTATVTANVSKTVETYFARVIGINSIPVGASATAEITTASALGCGFLPLAIPYRDPQDWPTGEFAIWQKFPQSFDITRTVDIHPSMVGWLNLDGKLPFQDEQNMQNVAAEELKCWVCPDCTKDPNPGVDLGWVNGSPGTMDKVLQEVKRCLEGKTVYVPLYGPTCCWQDKSKDPRPSCWQDGFDDLGNGQCQYDIVAFAPFHINLVQDTTNLRAIYGTYEKDYIGDKCLVAGGGGKPSKLHMVRLIK